MNNMLYNIFDSHAHYNDSKFDETRDEILNSLPSAGISRVINVGASLEESFESVELAKKYDYIFSSVGVHPYSAEGLPGDYLETLASLSSQDKAIAIGEIGLDYFRDTVSKEIQKRVFEEQLSLAHELKLPVIIHSREADQDTLDILKRFKIRGVVHCFSSSYEVAQILTGLGFYLGFTGVITFKNNIKHIKTISQLPLDKFLIETDCPYMAPEPHRGKVCDSTMLPHIIEKIAVLKNESAQKIADQTNINACELFNIK